MREDMNDQLSKRGPVPGDVYRKVAKAAAEAIRNENAGHLVIADGNNVGSSVIPEITILISPKAAGVITPVLFLITKRMGE